LISDHGVLLAAVGVCSSRFLRDKNLRAGYCRDVPTKDRTAAGLARRGGKARAALPFEELSRIGKLDGRPRSLYRCPCGAMTIERAAARNHRCTATS
jgi:hypothetical protein